jgi:hypothetical protein
MGPLLGPRFPRGMLRRAGSFLRPEEAAGSPKGIFVRKSDLYPERFANMFLYMSR